MHESWRPFLKAEFEKPYFCELSEFLHQAYETSVVYPPKVQVFSAFTTDLTGVKVVILGQDPYHTPNTAHGLAFSVQPGQKLPPSLQNIYKEIDNEFGVHQNSDGNLRAWQQQGVFLLNNVLTVEAHQPGSHRGHGWEIFTEAVVKYLDQERDHLVFLLWGRDAQSKANLINREKHLILTAAHPSPFSAHRGFFGCDHFRRANEYLEQHGETPIVW